MSWNNTFSLTKKLLPQELLKEGCALFDKRRVPPQGKENINFCSLSLMCSNTISYLLNLIYTNIQRHNGDACACI